LRAKSRLVREFVQRVVVPAHERAETRGQWDRSLFVEAGRLGLLGFSVPEQFGGPGVDDFRYNAILIDELQRAGAAAEAIAFTLQNDVVLPYLTDLTTPEQQQRWLPGVVTGETVLGIAMTEPGTGSDLAGIRTAAVRDGDHYVVNGAKTFISNGQCGDLFVVAVRTSPDRHTGLSLLVVDAGTPGFSRGRNLEKIGLHAQDTSELTFTDMRVPVANLLGEEGRGFYQLMQNLPQERLALGWARWPPPRPSWPRRWTTSGSAPRSERRSPAFSTANSCSPRWRPKSTSPERISTTAWPSTWPAS
jgi:alkylation response protein AidB-like acyl-CoA dehydrogenase